jgi:hypothetical protein
MLVDLKEFTKHLRSNALPKYGKGRCGEYVRKALQAGGARFNGKYPPAGKEYGPALEMLGFHQITVDDPSKFSFVESDVMVMEPYKGDSAGHVAAFDGKNWVSDFVQNDFWAGPRYRNQKPRPTYAVYRY